MNDTEKQIKVLDEAINYINGLKEKVSKGDVQTFRSESSLSSIADESVKIVTAVDGVTYKITLERNSYKVDNLIFDSKTIVTNKDTTVSRVATVKDVIDVYHDMLVSYNVGSREVLDSLIRLPSIIKGNSNKFSFLIENLEWARSLNYVGVDTTHICINGNYPPSFLMTTNDIRNNIDLVTDNIIKLLRTYTMDTLVDDCFGMKTSLVMYDNEYVSFRDNEQEVDRIDIIYNGIIVITIMV